MNRTKCLFIILFLLFLPTVCATEAASGASAEGVLICEVQPYGGCEGFSLFNCGIQTVNLKGWSATDGEGTLSFVSDLKIEPGMRLTIVKSISADDWFSGRDNVILLDDKCIQKKGSFILADAGDDLYLYRGSILVDTVCYGNKIALQGWIGDPARLPSSKYLLRTGAEDTDTLSDWTATKPGLTNRSFDPDLFFDALVTPFSFPESEGIPVFRELEAAQEEILISIYLLTSVRLTALLCEKSQSGVNVCVLLEGNMLGDNSFSTELALMKTLSIAGGDVRIINDPIAGNFERFSYVHNKYAVIDGRTVIVTSENWTENNLSPGCSNRGWGAVIESVGFAGYVREIFFDDFDPDYGDVRALSDYSPGQSPYLSLPEYAGTPQYDANAFEAKVMPVFSPDNSHPALRHFIAGAETRVYSQQLSIGSSYKMMGDNSPLKWLADAAERDIEVKLILDASFDKKTVEETALTINNMTCIKALAVDGKTPLFSLIHNKGVVADDKVWVGSVNWTENSFLNNREIAVIIDSKEIADFFAELFLEDWGVNIHTVEEEGLHITMEELFSNSGKILIFTVSGPASSTYTWDVLGNGEKRVSAVNKIVCRALPAGPHTITVTLDGTSYSASLSYVVEEEEILPEEIETPWGMIGGALAAAVGVGVIFVRKNINRDSGIPALTNNKRKV